MGLQTERHINRRTVVDRPDDMGSRGPVRKVIAPATGKSIDTSLDSCINDNRVPSFNDLYEECKCLLGVHLIALRSASDALKAIQGVTQAVKAISTMQQAEQLSAVSESMLENMDQKDMVAYAKKLIDNMKN